MGNRLQLLESQLVHGGDNRHSIAECTDLLDVLDVRDRVLHCAESPHILLEGLIVLLAHILQRLGCRSPLVCPLEIANEGLVQFFLGEIVSSGRLIRHDRAMLDRTVGK